MQTKPFVPFKYRGGDSRRSTGASKRSKSDRDNFDGKPSEERAKALGVKALSSGRGSPTHLKAIADAVANKTINAETRRVFPLKEVRAAQDLSQTGHGRGRIVLKV